MGAIRKATARVNRPALPPPPPVKSKRLVAYRCPGCDDEVTTMPNSTVMHRCPKKQSRALQYRPVKETD